MEKVQSSGVEIREELRERTKPKQVIDSFTTRNAALVGSNSGDRTVSDMWSLVNNWPTPSHVWPLLYGSVISGSLAGIAGAIVNRKFRSYIVMANTASFTSYLGSIGIPLSSATMGHYLFVSSDIIEQKTVCSTCVQVRSMILQIGAGVVIPTALVPITNLSVLSRMKSTVRLPDLSRDPIALLKYVRDVTKTYRTSLVYLVAIQMLFASGITYLQQDAYFTNIVPYLKGSQTLSSPN